MKSVQGKNYFLLALAIVYGVIALIQISTDGILGTQLYYSIAFISLNTTLCECAKSSIMWIRTLKQHIKENDVGLQNNVKRHIDVLSKYSDLSELTVSYQTIYDDAKQHERASSKKRWVKVLDLVESAIQFFEVFGILCIGLITPLKKIPNNLQVTKTIDVLSLLSVALAFFSIYLNESIAKSVEKSQNRIRDLFRTSNYYLDIIEEISKGQPAEKTLTDGNGEGEK